LFAGTDALAGDAKANFNRIPSSVRQLDYSSLVAAEITGYLQDTSIVVDALFGTGLTKALSGIYEDAVRLVNSCGAPVIAVDIPSGVDATTGKVPGEAVKADITVTFGAAKTGQFLYPGAEHVGELLVTDIGIPSELLDKVPFIEIIDEKYATGILGPRRRTSHKGSYGHCLIIAGSTGKSGAAAMAANSAMRCGAGLVTLAVPSAIHPIVEVKTTEAMTVPLPETSAGSISIDSLRAVRKLLDGKDALAIGPGLGLHGETGKVVREIVSMGELPLVLDADALNIIAKDISCLKA
jgi:NAD(P)H-hydrate epimerase